MIVLIKYSIDSDIFNPVLAEVLKHPQNSLDWANSCREGSSSSPFSKRSALFSTKRQGNFPPSKNVAASSTEPFHLSVLIHKNIYIICI